MDVSPWLFPRSDSAAPGEPRLPAETGLAVPELTLRMPQTVSVDGADIDEAEWLINQETCKA